MTFNIELISPEIAQKYIDSSVGNRSIAPRVVSKYASDMERGKWLMNGIPIVFDEQNHLIDGHHRLKAVIEAGVSIRFSVVRGAEEGSFATFDCGRHRTFGQLLDIKGVSNYNAVAAIVAAYQTLNFTGRLFQNNNLDEEKRTTKRSNQDNMEVYLNDAENFDRVAAIVVNFKNKFNVLIGSWTGAIYYYLVFIGHVDEDLVFKFFDNLYSPDTSSIGCVDLLRKRLIRTKLNGEKMQPIMLWGLIAKTWNYYYMGITPKILVFNPQKEKAPTLLIKKQLTL